MSPGSAKLPLSAARWDLLRSTLLAYKAPLCKLEKDSPYLSDATLAWQAEPSANEKKVPHLYISGLQTFSIKDQMVNILGFASYKVSVTTTQVSHCHTKATIDDTSTNGCGSVPKYSYL